MNLKPIRKIAVGLLAAGIVYLAKRAGLDIGPDALNDILDPLVGFLAAWAVRDPRVRHAVDSLEDSEVAGLVEQLVLAELAKHGIAKTGAAVSVHVDGVHVDGRAIARAVGDLR